MVTFPNIKLPIAYQWPRHDDQYVRKENQVIIMSVRKLIRRYVLYRWLSFNKGSFCLLVRPVRSCLDFWRATISIRLLSNNAVWFAFNYSFAQIMFFCGSLHSLVTSVCCFLYPENTVFLTSCKVLKSGLGIQMSGFCNGDIRPWSFSYTC